MSPSLLIATLVLPGLWGFLVGIGAHRWWPVGHGPPAPAKPTPSRPTDYSI